MEEVGEETKIERKNPRITTAVCNGQKGLRLQPEAVDTLGHDTYGKVCLATKEGSGVRGGGGESGFGRSAQPAHRRFFQLSATRKHIFEIAGFIAHKLARHIGDPAKYPEASGID